LGVDAMSKILYTGMKVLKIFWRGVISHQNADIHPVHNFLRAKTLKVLADGSIRLSKFVWFVQHFFIEGKKGYIWQEDCGLIIPADGVQELREVEALDSHSI